MGKILKYVEVEVEVEENMGFVLVDGYRKTPILRVLRITPLYVKRPVYAP